MRTTGDMINHLIVLPCHSIWTPKDDNDNGQLALSWTLAPFQIKGHDHECFVDHITQALKLTEADPSSVLVISGGQTKAECGQVSELSLYYNLGRRLAENAAVFDRVSVEEYARDLFENVFFSLCRFYEMMGRYPSKITIVGFEFKRERFEKLHLKQALAFPGVVTYLGNLPKPDGDYEEYFDDLAASEEKYAVVPFTKDWYGVGGELAEKKRQRNPFGRVVPYEKSNPKLVEAFVRMARGERERVREVLPWCQL